MKIARNWTLAFLGTVVAVMVCYAWLDRPIALMVHAEFHEYDLFEKLTLIPTAVIPLAVVALVALGLRGLAGGPLSRLPTVILLGGVSLAAGEAVKDQLKLGFGR